MVSSAENEIDWKTSQGILDPEKMLEWFGWWDNHWVERKNLLELFVKKSKLSI